MPAADSAASGSVLLVLGMHRSGTSLLSGLLARAGMDLGASIMEAADDNPTGFWENTRIVNLHEQFLNTLGHTWSSCSELPEGWRESDEAAVCRRELAGLLDAEFEQRGNICIKDPRLCRLLPMWRDLGEELGLTLRCASIVRPAEEVVASLEKRDSLGHFHGRALWMRYNLEMAEHGTGLPTWRTSYDALLQNPEAALEALADKLELSLEAADKGFVDPELKHHRCTPPADATGTLYRLLSEGSESPPAYLRDEVMPMAQDLADLEAKLTHASVDADSLSGDQLANARERALFEQTQDAKRYAGSMERELETGRSYVTAMEAELEQRQAYALNLEQEIAARDTDIQEKSQFIGSLEAHVATLDEELERRETFVASLQEELQQRTSAMTSEMASLKSELDKLQ